MRLRRAKVRDLVKVALPWASIALLASSCEPIVPQPITKAPLNECPCGRYEGGTTAAICSSRGRCEILTAGGRPEFPFWIVVHVPDTSLYAPGLTYVLYSDARGFPAFEETSPAPGVINACRPPSCLLLGALVGLQSEYFVESSASSALGYPLDRPTSIPVRVVYEPIGNDQQSPFPVLPVPTLFGASELVGGGAAAVRAVPAGTYRRTFYPEAPFDSVFPPVTGELSVESGSVNFRYSLSEGEVDDLAGDSRVATVSREGGLDGWRAWLVDRPSQRRISVVRTLSGTQVTVPLYTSGEARTPGGGLGDDVEAIVAPPEGWIGVPRLVTRLFSGAGLKNLAYPVIPPPVSVAGVVAQPEGVGDTLLGYPARVRFESESITTSTEPSRLLRYSATVDTDDRGRFATILPPGTYVATIEPAEGTGFAPRKENVVVDRVLTSLILRPPPRRIVSGRAVLTDGRPLSEADVIAVPNRLAATQWGSSFAMPRPSRARTGEDGRYALELDPGPYILSVVPQAGTGFPRVVVRADVPDAASLSVAEVSDVRIPELRVPVPSRLAFTLRAPATPQIPIQNPIQNALVRIFAMPASVDGMPVVSDPVEIGSAMTDATGAVEILLAQEPH